MPFVWGFLEGGEAGHGVGGVGGRLSHVLGRPFLCFGLLASAFASVSPPQYQHGR